MGYPFGIGSDDVTWGGPVFGLAFLIWLPVTICFVISTIRWAAGARGLPNVQPLIDIARIKPWGAAAGAYAFIVGTFALYLDGLVSIAEWATGG